MIRHMVALRFKPEIKKADIDAVADELAGLRQTLGGIADYAFRDNVSPETEVVHGFNHMFWFDFETEAARDAYLVDPNHQAVGAKLVAMALDGPEGIFVCDVEL